MSSINRINPVLIILILLINSIPGNTMGQGLKSKNNTGELLAKQYCSVCHLFVEPALLDKKTWTQSVLPNMGWRLGIRKPDDDPFKNLDESEAKAIKALNIYPDAQLIAEKDWQKIIAYFTEKAPDKVIVANLPVKIGNAASRFKAIPLTIGENIVPSTTAIKYDHENALLYVADAENGLFIIDKNYQMTDYWRLNSPAVDFHFTKNKPPQVLCIGSIKPSEAKNGFLITLDKSENPEEQHQPITALGRPVHFTVGDINLDGKSDLLISAFGNHSGKFVAYLDQKPENEVVLKNQAGARKSIVKDMNKDGKPDILIMLAQAREQILLLTNMGNGKFEEKKLLEFPPVYGCSNFELADFNHDGFDDILMTNGDNWDLSAIRKKFHGVRIFLNNGKNQFKESYFFPLYGASKAMACDFDKDGDLDIAAISFYDDPDDPSEGFVLLENTGNNQFLPSYTMAANSGKWLTMDIADINQDGRTDILLGSYFHNANEVTKLATKGITDYPNILILLNSF